MASTKRQRPEPDDDEDEAPVRKKKKKKKKKQAAPPWKLIAGAAGGVVALILIVFILLKSTGGPGVTPVTAWEKYSTDENEFGFDVPADWKTKGFGKAGSYSIETKKGSASIQINENLMGSLLGDIAGAGGGGLREVNEDQTPVARVHDMRRPKDKPGYNEGAAVTVMTRFGKGRRSPYTEGSHKGYRATILMRGTALDVFCDCSAADWEVARPTFERVIESIGIGGG